MAASLRPEFTPTLRGQERELDQSPERAQLIAGSPNQADFVVVQEAGLLAIRLFGPLHSADDGRHVVLVSGGVEVADTPNTGEHGIGLRPSMLVGHMVKQIADLAASDVEEFLVAHLRVDVLVQNAFDLRLGSQSVRIDVTLDPVLGNFLETVGVRLRGELLGIVVVVAYLLRASLRDSSGYRPSFFVLALPLV